MRIRLLFILLLFAISSCNPNIVFEQNQVITEGLWPANKPIEFKVLIEDNNEAYNLFLNLRNDNTYPYANLYIFLKTVYPNGRSEQDTLQFILADKRGKWYGEGLGDIKSSSVMFRYKLRFPMNGEYRFMMAQGMRVDSLVGIRDIGLRIEKIQE